MDAPITRSTVPTRFGPYLLTECLGRGGMAAIYKGKRRGLAGFEKQVVVKTILPTLASNHNFVRLFKQEARVSAMLEHTNVVQVHDFGIVGNTPFLELEYYSGWNLKQLWERLAERGERMPVPIALTLITDVCRGLAYAHSFVDDAGVRRPIIHRDVSPSNVMICRDGAVKLLDFGLACLTRGEVVAIETFHGKLAYMSPEQLQKRQLDRRADVFALGAVTYELLTGERLFAAKSNPETLHRLRNLPILPPSKSNPTVPAALDVIVLRALCRDPDQRYQSAAEMLAAFERLTAQAANRDQLLRYLGTVAPEVFTVACDSCGQRLPCGSECPTCRTQLSDFDAQLAAAPTSTPPPPPLAALRPRPRHSMPRARAWLRQIAAWLSMLQAWLRATVAGVRSRVPGVVATARARTRALRDRCAKIIGACSTVIAQRCSTVVAKALAIARRRKPTIG